MGGFAEVAAPVARPLINVLDYAQRTNTIGSLRADDVSRVMAPVIVPSQQQVNPIVVQPKSDAMTTAALAHSAATLAKVEKTMAKLNERLSEPFVTVNTVSYTHLTLPTTPYVYQTGSG